MTPAAVVWYSAAVQCATMHPMYYAVAAWGAPEDGDADE